APEGVGVSGQAWHTRAMDDLVFVLQVTDASPTRVTARFAEDAGLFEAEVEREVLAELPLRVRQRAEGVEELRISATDALGRTTEHIVQVHVDRTAPMLARLPSDFIDERGAEVDCLPGEAWPVCELRRGEARIDLGPEAPDVIDLFKLQTHLGPDDDNLPVLRFQVADGVTGTPGGQVEVSFADPPHRRLAVPADAPNERRLTLTAEALGIVDPLVEIPDDGALWPPDEQRMLVVRDLAGNEAQVALPTLRLHILAPPLFVVEQPIEPAPGVSDVAALDAQGLSAHAAQDSDALAVGGWALYNPWPVPVSYQLGRPASGGLTLTGEITRVTNDVLSPLGEDPERFAADIWSSTQLHAGCLARTRTDQENGAVSGTASTAGRPRD
ncbi:MAG: hypothetical protein R3F43_30595, partial [bacterium]